MNRVLLVGALPPPSGGVVTHVRDLVRALALAGVTVEALDPRRDGPDGRDGRPRLVARLALAAARGELVHCHTNGHNRNSWLLALLCAAGRPSLLTLHSGLAPAFILRHRRLARAVVAGHRLVIAVNPEIAAALVAAGVPDEKVVVCPAFSAASLAFRLAPPGLGALRRRHRFLLAAALAPGPEYGAHVLLDGFARARRAAPSLGLILYGPGTRDAALAARLAADGLADAVHLLGELPRERALAVVAAADAFIRPTLADGDAISVREALALGRTVIASAVGQRPAEALTFPAGSPAALAEMIFHAAGKPRPTIVSPTGDCLPTLLSIYRQSGLRLASETFGTPLAKAP